MKVLFIYPNIARARSPQVGVSSLAGMLRDHGHDSRVYDITFLSDDEMVGALKATLEEYKPDLVGVSCRSTEWETALALLRMINIPVPVVAGGPHPTIAPEEVIADESIDIVVRGEGEETLMELIRRMEAGGDLSDILGLWLKRDGEVFRNDMRPLIQDLDSLPFPRWEIWDGRHFRGSYHQVFSPQSEIFADLETARGCPYACPYCLNPAMQKLYRGKGKYHREKSARRMIAEIERMREVLKVDYIRFIDETFIFHKERLIEFCRMYREIGLPFYFMTRPETVTDEIMAELAAAGANCVSFGLESGNEAYRREVLNRRTKQQQVIDAVAIAKKHGLKTFAFVMIGLPDEDRAKIQDTIDLINILQPDIFEISIFYPFIGTPFYQYCIEHGLLASDHERLTEVWKGSVLDQPQLPSDYLIRLRELMLAFSKGDRCWWPLMYFLEKHPAAFQVWLAQRRLGGFGKKVARRLSWPRLTRSWRSRRAAS